MSFCSTTGRLLDCFQTENAFYSGLGQSIILFCECGCEWRTLIAIRKRSLGEDDDTVACETKVTDQSRGADDAPNEY